jgi:hypothetical protein
MSGFNFTQYLINYETIQAIGSNKTRKQFKNFLRVMYGRKKDRGHIKKRVENYIQDQHSHLAQLYGTIGRVLEKYAPGITSMMGGPYGWL